MAGVDVNTATLALDVIDTVGPSGHFLGQRHTMQRKPSTSTTAWRFTPIPACEN
ncbi:MAG: trimethylamine methyltransferase family protein [Anaerolineae bacterium]|nr:trimethylamine methyltransferase family protein [Anaerolineae bacterium]